MMIQVPNDSDIIRSLSMLHVPMSQRCCCHTPIIGEETCNAPKGSRGSFTMDLELTQDCNYACRYCIERGYFEPKIMKPHIVEEVLRKSDYLLGYGKYCDVLTFGFWGGEPTLNREAIEQIINHYDKDDRVSYSIFTNSRLLSNFYELIEKANSIRDGRFNVQVSYDGYKVHELNRIDRDGKTTAQEVRNNIIELAKKQYIFHIKSTLTFKDLSHMYESYLDICDLSDECSAINPGRGFINYSPTLDYSILTYEKLDDISVIVLLALFEEELIKIANNEYKRRKQGKSPIFAWFQDLDTTNRSVRAKCCAGYRYKCINYDGDLLVCHGCLFSPNKKDHYLGHIFNKNKHFLRALINSDKLFNTINRGNQLIPEPLACKGCDASICYCCNAIKYELSKRNDYMKRWWDSSNQPKLCKFYRVASNVLAALRLKILIDAQYRPQNIPQPIFDSIAQESQQ